MKEPAVFFVFFDLANYIIVIAVIAAIYIAVTNFAQGNVGGKNRLKNLQLELRDVQKKMTEAAKNKNDKEVDEAINQNWKITGELLTIQMQLAVLLIGVLFVLMNVFPYIEPGMADDARLPLFDDGLAMHCDAFGGDGIFSNCYALPSNATPGIAWTAHAELYNSAGEILAKNATAIYVEGGTPEDVWLQSSSQSGFIDGLLGKKAYTLNVTVDKKQYSMGDRVEIHSFSSPSVPSGGKIDAVLDKGTKFYIDLPVAIPLINIRRIIGSYGVFIFLVFLLGLAYSLLKGTIEATRQKKPG